MNKYYWIGGIIAIIIIIIFLYFELPLILCLTNINPNSCCQVTLNEQALITCYRIALNNSDEKTCLKIIGATEREECTYDVVRKLNSTSVCEEIKKEYYSLSDYSPVDIDKDYCYTDLAVYNKDLTLCKKVTDTERDNCYIKVALVRNDSSICDTITAKNICYIAFAKQNQDSSFCNKIDNQNTKDSCFLLVKK